MKPTAEWLNSFNKHRDKLLCPAPLNDYFTLSEMAGKKLDLLDFGLVSIRCVISTVKKSRILKKCHLVSFTLLPV